MPSLPVWLVVYFTITHFYQADVLPFLVYLMCKTVSFPLLQCSHPHPSFTMLLENNYPVPLIRKNISSPLCCDIIQKLIMILRSSCDGSQPKAHLSI